MTMKTYIAVCLSVIATGAVAQSVPRPVSAADVAARPVLVVAPAFPALAPGEATSAEIRVSGIVSQAGSLDAAEFVPAPGKEKYVQAVREVLHLWKFRPAISESDCAPVAQKQTFVVWFGQDGGKPSVSVSIAKSNPSASATTGAGGTGQTRSWRQRPSIEFPEAAQERGIEGAAEVALQVNASGEILKSTLVYATPLSVFGEAAMRGVRSASLAPLASAGGDKACMVVPFGFCTEGIPAVPNSACSRS